MSETEVYVAHIHKIKSAIKDSFKIETKGSKILN